MQPVKEVLFNNVPSTFEKPLERKEETPSVDLFKRNLHCQLQMIRNLLEQSIKGTESVNATTSPFQEFAIKEHDRLIKEHFGSKENLTIVDAEKLKPADAILSSYTLHNKMEDIFNASEALLKGRLSVEEHPIYRYFSHLNEEGIFVASLTSGPDIASFTNLMLKNDGLETAKAGHIEHLNLKIFNSVETFLRSLDIFKTHFEKKTGKTINVDLSCSLVPQELSAYCDAYIKKFPELAHLDVHEREKFVRLLSVFTVDGAVVDNMITLKMSVGPKTENQRSFWPLNQEHQKIQKGSNEISLGQLDTKHQIQNLNGSNESMKYIKNADGLAQFAACKRIVGRQDLKIVDMGGGRGETNGFQHALLKEGSTIHLLNFDPDPNFENDYINHHNSIGIDDVKVKLKKIQDLTSQEVIEHFSGEKVDLVYSSHCFYFILGDMLKAALDPSIPLHQFPTYKYFEMLRDDGVLLVTMQKGSGSRLIRNALLGDHGLTPPVSEVADDTVLLLKSFGNVDAFLRYFEPFKKRFKEETGKTIEVKMHYAVANVPLGEFTVEQDAETGGYVIHNPNGSDKDKAWLSKTMLSFYGNWKEQQLLATLTEEKYKQMTPEKIKKWKLENLTSESIALKRAQAKKTQETFLHILRAFAPAEENMQHPNVTLEITVK